MPRNVEIKAHLADLQGVRLRLAALAGEGPVRLLQEDTFFPVAEGRLKLRRFPDGTGELIRYRRPDVRGPGLSEYEVFPTSRGGPLRDLLAAALGIRGTVHKERELYRVGRTRIHLDRVEGLGAFLELEVMLEPGEPSAEGERAARELMGSLGIEAEALVDVAYIDLLERR
ncbi:MAG: class IV adenylate cyclase [Acidobacteriota bacterium]